jgi:hypothetical protein
VQTLKAIPGSSFLLPCAWAVLLLLCIALYWPNLHAGYFSDDFLFFFDSPPAHLYNYFSQMGAAAHAYRPIEAIVLTIIQKHFRFDTFPNISSRFALIQHWSALFSPLLGVSGWK